MSYTWLSLGAVALTVALDLAGGTSLVLRKAFWTSYAIMAFFQLIANGILTGLPVVRYDADVILGPRIANAPVEDLFFGFALILLTLLTWVHLGRSRVAGR